MTHIYVPKCICAVGIIASTIALLVQAAIDIDQGTVGMPLFSRQWFVQAWQMSLVTLFIIVLVSFGGRFLHVGAIGRASLLYVIVGALMTMTVINGADFIADSSVAERMAAGMQQQQAKDIADIKNRFMLDERKVALENAWRTYTAARTPAERERVLNQIQNMTKDGPNITAPEVKVVHAGSGAIWNRWLGWRPEGIQEVKAIALPVLVMLCKTIGLSLGFAYWPARDAGSRRQATDCPVEFNEFNPEFKARFRLEDARADIVGLQDAGKLNTMNLSKAAFAERWGVSPSTGWTWLQRFESEGLIQSEPSGKRNETVIRTRVSS
jgi:hypothetical protein